MTDLTHASLRDLGKALRARRKSLGLTRADLATRIDVSPSLVTRMENARVEIDVIRFVRWCSTLGLRVEVVETLTPQAPHVAEMVYAGEDGA